MSPPSGHIKSVKVLYFGQVCSGLFWWISQQRWLSRYAKQDIKKGNRNQGAGKLLLKQKKLRGKFVELLSREIKELKKSFFFSSGTHIFKAINSQDGDDDSKK